MLWEKEIKMEKNYKNGGNVCYMYLLIGYIRDEEGVKQKKR